MLDFIVMYFDVIAGVFSLASIVFMLWMKSKFVPKEDHDKIKADFEEAVRRIDHMEIRVAQMPDFSALQALALQMTRLEGDLKGFIARFEGMDTLIERMQSQADRMEDFLKAKM